MICLHTVKWLQVLRFNINYSIQYYSFVCSQLNGSKYNFAPSAGAVEYTDCTSADG